MHTGIIVSLSIWYVIRMIWVVVGNVIWVLAILKHSYIFNLRTIRGRLVVNFPTEI